MKKSKIHISVLFLFATAFIFYSLSWVTTANGLILLGFLFEILAWASWFDSDSKVKDSSGLNQDKK